MTAEQLASEHGEALIRARQGAAKVSLRYGVDLEVAQNALFLARKAKKQNTSAEDAADAITAYFSKPTKAAEPQPLSFRNESEVPPEKPQKRTRIVFRKKEVAPAGNIKEALFQALRNAPFLGGASLTDEFFCRAKDRTLQLEGCLDSYMNANAFRRTSEVCFNCPQGCDNRNAFAKGLPLPSE